jgi:hypothetical protein
MAQSCQNNGYQNGSTCACPPGFGGVNCTQPACGGNIFQGTSRPLVSASSSFPNITASNCSCQNGWSGTGCNVCQTASACQNAFSAAGGQTTTTPDSSSLGPGAQNDTMVCSATPQVYAAGEMSCKVIVRILSFAYQTKRIICEHISRIPLSRAYIQGLQHSTFCAHSTPLSPHFQTSLASAHLAPCTLSSGTMV